MSEKILLLSCCAPCSCAVIEKLAAEQADFTVVFYNPNIQPEEEYRKRCDENKRLCAALSVPFVALEYDTERWCSLTQGLEKEPERGRRCSVCFHMRLKRVMEYAKANGFTHVASVLGVSRYKNLAQVNEAAAGRPQKQVCLIWKLKGASMVCRNVGRRLSKSWGYILSPIAAAPTG